MKKNNNSGKTGTSLVMDWELTLEDFDIINQDCNEMSKLKILSMYTSNQRLILIIFDISEVVS